MMHMDRRPILFELGMSLNGLLRPAELQEIWHSLETQPCTANLPVVERDWRNRFEAVGNRDLHAMAALAASLLAQLDEIPEGREFLAAGALRSQRARENSQGPQAPWQRMRSQLVQGGQTKPGLWLLLEVLAAARRPAL